VCKFQDGYAKRRDDADEQDLHVIALHFYVRTAGARVWSIKNRMYAWVVAFCGGTGDRADGVEPAF
jgi:hypothetical protein